MRRKLGLARLRSHPGATHGHPDHVQRPDGKDASGYLAKAGSANAPGVVVIQEWWGLQDQIKGICDRFALAGYEALAPDLYAGTVVPYHDADAANQEMSSLNFLDATDQTVRGAAQLSQEERRQGRAHRLLHGRRGDDPRRLPRPGAQRRVCFYGIPPDSGGQARRHQGAAAGPLRQRRRLVHAGSRRCLRGGLKTAGKKPELYRYDAEHGFVNEQRHG